MEILISKEDFETLLTGSMLAFVAAQDICTRLPPDFDWESDLFDDPRKPLLGCLKAMYVALSKIQTAYTTERSVFEDFFPDSEKCQPSDSKSRLPIIERTDWFERTS